MNFLKSIFIFMALMTLALSPVWGAEKDSKGDTKADKKIDKKDPELEKLIKDAQKEAGEEKTKQKEKQKSTFDEITQKFNEFNPRLTVFGDGVYQWADRDVIREGEEVSRRFFLREVEVDFRAAIDPYAKGVLIIAFGQEEPHEFETGIEEGYLTLETLPFNLRAKLGRFRTDFGLINKLHLHDLPQTNYPLAVQRFLGEEGYVDEGVSLSYLFPFAPLEATFQAVNGDKAESPPAYSDDNLNTDHPALLGHLKFYNTVAENFDFETGASYLWGYGDEDNEVKSQLFGLDFFFRWKPLKKSNYWSFVLQGELFYAERERGGTTGVYSYGYYVFAQLQAWKNWYFGARYDYSEDLENKDREDYKLSGYVSYYTTEFMRFRVGYEYFNKDQNEEDVHSIFFQFTFVFGSHPVEPYWFNK